MKQNWVKQNWVGTVIITLNPNTKNLQPILEKEAKYERFVYEIKFGPQVTSREATGYEWKIGPLIASSEARG